jgi:hypothetical protein
MTDRFISSDELSEAELNLVSGGRYSATANTATFSASATMPQRPTVNQQGTLQILPPTRGAFFQR